MLLRHERINIMSALLLFVVQAQALEIVQIFLYLELGAETGIRGELSLFLLLMSVTEMRNGRGLHIELDLHRSDGI